MWNSSVSFIKDIIYLNLVMIQNAEQPCLKTIGNPFQTTPSRQSKATFFHHKNLVHLADQSVDVLLTVAKITTLNEVLELAGTEAASRVGQLERPQEVGGLLEVGANRVNLVDKIFHADDAVLAEGLFNDGVVGQGSALLVHFAVSSFVDKVLYGLQVGVTVSDPRLDNLQHLGSGLGGLDEDAIVDLQKTKKLECLARLGRHFVDTLDANNKDQLGFSGDVGRVVLLGKAVQANLLTLSIAVLLDVLLSTLEDDTTLLLVGLFEQVMSALHNGNRWLKWIHESRFGSSQTRKKV